MVKMLNRRRAGALTAVALIALLLTLLLPNFKFSETPTPTPTPCKTGDPVKVVSAWLIDKGFDADSFKVSLKGFNPPKGSEAYNNGSHGNFADNPVLNIKQLNRLLRAKTGSDGIAAAIIADRVNGRNAIPVAVMFTGKVNIEGNLGVSGGKATDLGTRRSAAGDVVWVFVDQSNCDIIAGIVVRAGCGNPGKDVHPPDPGPKPGPTPTPTPTPSPTPTPTPKPTPTCPPGQNVNVNGICVEPKSPDPSDYTYPSGKPSVPPVTTPPENSPPPVETEKPGGGGVTDSPTKPPGSESGVTAPGASPAPTTAPSPPPNEGGNNSGPPVSGF